MNARSGFGALGPGAISIAAEAADGRICSVRIVSSRPTNLTRLFIGRPAQEIPALAERLYSLCGLAHALAATQAIAAARGANPPAHGSTIGLLCERLSETLRSSATAAVSRSDAYALDELALRPLRDMLALTRELASTARVASSSAAPNHAPARGLIERIYAAAEQLGLHTRLADARAAPRKGSLFGELWEEMRGDQGFTAHAPDALAAEDDAAILRELRRDSENFVAAPWLTGRTPETGAFVRHWRDVDFSGGALQARLQARIIDVAHTLEQLSRAGEDEETAARSANPAPREGFAAVETARGTLYHWARLTADDNIEDYAILAPTEWNFHPAGPFVAELLGAPVAQGGALRSIARLASLLDPCVVFRVEVAEAAHA